MPPIPNQSQAERRQYLIDTLMAGNREFKEVDRTSVDPDLLLRALMNRQMPQNYDPKFIEIQDTYLKKVAEQKGIVRLEDLPSIQDALKSKHPFADKLSLWQGDITRLGLDAIVNAANSQMLGCFVPNHKCIDNAIHSAAGLELRNACHAYMTEKRAKDPQYEEPTGRAVLTPAYNLPCQYVIHTVGPIVYPHLTQAHRAQLASSYQSILELASQHQVRSLAFCCISTGEFRFPNQEAATIAIQVVDAYLADHEGDFDRIVFNVFKDEDDAIYERLLK